MKKFNLAKLLSLVLVFTLLMGTFAVLPASAAEAPSIKFVSNNVFFGEKIHLMYAVETANAPAGAEVVVTVSDGTNTYATEEKSDATYGTVYVSKSGVAAQNIATVYTATATLVKNGETIATATQTYSVLEYLYTRLLVSTEKTEAQVAMYNSLLDYAAKAEAVLCADRETKVNDYVLVTAKDATVNGETSLIVKKGTAVTPVLDAGFTVPSGKALVWNVTPYGGATVTYTAEEIANGIEVNGNVDIAAAVIEGAIEEIKSYEYTFAAADVTGYGTPVKLGDATWTITGDSTYIGSVDANKGLQFGKSKEAHTALTFTSADRFGDVTKIVINTSGASGTNAKLTVTVGGTQIGETISLTSAATEYEFTSTTPISGVIVLSYTQTTATAIYLKNMAVNPVAVEEPEPEEPENPGAGSIVYKLVTDLSQLKAGDKIVIVAKDSSCALSTTQNSNNRGQASVTKSGDVVTFGSDVQVITLEAGAKAGTFAFNVGGYLYAASSGSNYLRTEEALSNNSSWSITIAADGTATIVAQGTNTRNTMQYNSGSSLFACYASASQKAICIYVETTV